MLTNVLIFVLSLGLLILAARFFTSSAEVIGRVLGMSEFAIGVLIVSVGTSLPELITAVVSVNRGVSELVAGNVIGSSISNLLFVLGMTSLCARTRIDLGNAYIFIDLNYLIGSIFLIGLIMHDGVVTASEGVFGLAAYFAYTYYLLQGQSKVEELHADVDESLAPKATSQAELIRAVVVLLLSGVAIYFGANYTVGSLSNLAETLGVSKAIVSVTLLSFGTTLPELVVSLSAARAGKGAMAFGNVLGSCIFNSLVIMGVASFFGQLVVADDLRFFALPAFAGATLLFYLLTQDKMISKFEGSLFVILYFLFTGKVAGLV